MAITETQLLAWSKPVSKTEDLKCQNAIKQVIEAINTKFSTSVTIFLQGSYENNTNVKQDSDVDIVVRYNNVYFPDLQRLNEEQKNFYFTNIYIPATYTFAEFKTALQATLTVTFGQNVKRKNKCLLVEGNSTRINADVVPAFVLKRFKTDFGIEAEGIEFITDDGNEIQSFPEQHYKNGVSKTAATQRMYKRVVRILKNIRTKLIESNIITEDLTSSFFIESLVYNVSNDKFISGNYTDTLRNVIIVIYNDMVDLTVANKYIEVSGLKWLFINSHRTPEDAKQFMVKCWEYAGFN